MEGLCLILVTGGGGYLGAHLVNKLVKQGKNVVVYDAMSPHPEAFSDIDKVKVVRGDVLDLTHVLRVVKEENVDIILHTANLMTDACKRAPWLGIKLNIEGMVNMLEAARIMDLERVVFTSSRAVYGYAEEKLLDEEYPTHPASIYGITKLTSELLGENYANNYDVDFIAMRLPIVYGPPRAPMVFRGVSGAIYKMVTDSVRQQHADIPKGRDAVYEWIYVKDAVRALVLACFAKGLKHRIFNVSSEQRLGLQDIADAVKKNIPGAVINIGPGALLPSARGPLDISRARSELKYEPKYKIKEGIKSYIKWAEEQLKR